MFLWIKAFHIIAMVAWFSGLFYLPRLFVYHSEAQDEISIVRFKIMERRLYYGITWPAAVMTSLLGIWLILTNASYYLHSPWMHGKLFLVGLVWGYHLWCGHFRLQFGKDCNRHTTKFYRLFNEIPTLLLVGIVLLVVVKP